MKLHFKKYGDAGEPLIILHGLFGMLDNWHQLAQRFSSNYTVYTLDLRNHGNSPHESSMSYEEMAADINEFVEDHLLDKVHLLGHSMGGKVAMQVAADYPGILHKLIIADIAPKAYPPGHQVYFNALKSIDFGQMNRRSEADKALQAFVPEMGIRLFLLKNLKKEAQGYGLKMNLHVIEEFYSQIAGTITLDWPYNGKTLFLAGEKSNYITDDDQREIPEAFPNCEFKTINDAGHWLHADKPNDFFDAVMDFLMN